MAFRRWLIDSRDDLEDASVEVSVGATLEAESQWNQNRIRVTLEERLPSQ